MKIQICDRNLDIACILNSGYSRNPSGRDEIPSLVRSSNPAPWQPLNPRNNKKIALRTYSLIHRRLQATLLGYHAAWYPSAECTPSSSIVAQYPHPITQTTRSQGLGLEGIGSGYATKCTNMKGTLAKVPCCRVPFSRVP